MEINRIQSTLASFPEKDFSGGVSDNVIQEKSCIIGLTFPPQYIGFLRELGAGYVSSEEFIGLGGPEHLDVAWLTLQLRSRKSQTRFPDSLIPLRSDGYGNYDCIDTRRPTSDGEFKIVEWVHDAGDSQEYRPLANSFNEWFVNMLHDIQQLEQ